MTISPYFLITVVIIKLCRQIVANTNFSALETSVLIGRLKIRHRATKIPKALSTTLLARLKR